MEHNIDDMDYLLPKAVRNGHNIAMTEMFHSVEDAQEASRELEKTVLSLQQKSIKLYKEKTVDTPDNDQKEQACA